MKPADCAVLLVVECDEASPEGSYGAGAADDDGPAVDADLVAGGGVGVAGDVGDATAAGWVGGCGDLGAGLPGGQGEDVADAAAGGSAVGESVPDGFGGDGGAAALEVGATAAEDVGAGGGEVDVVLAVGLAVGGAVVAGGHGDGDAEGGGGLAGGVEGVEGLRGPTGLGAAPADGDDAGVVGGVVDGGGDGVDEALVGVGGEVDDDLCAGSDGGGDFDVEHDLAVGAVGVGGCVLAAVYGDGGDLRDWLAEAFEVGADVGGSVASAEFDDADGLVCCGGSCGESVELRDLDRCVGDVGGGVRLGEASALRCASREVVLLAEDAKVGPGLWTVVEAEDGFDVADELGGEIDAAFADAIGDAVEGLMTEGDAECLLHVGDGAGELDGAALGARGVGFDPEAEFLGEVADELRIRGRRRGAGDTARG